MDSQSFSQGVSFVLSIKDEVITSLWQTAVMVGVSTVASVIFGGLLGVLLFVTGKGRFLDHKRAHVLLGQVVNFMRAFPFVILVIALTDVTRAVTGTVIGPIAAAFVLSVSGVFYFARLVEQNLSEVPRGVVEAAEAMGAGPAKIVFGVLLTESRSGLALSVTILIIALLSESAAAGMIGGGGLGDLAIRYGHYRYQTSVIVFVVATRSILVIAIQALGNKAADALDKR